MNTHKAIVCGGRDFTDYDLLDKALTEICAEYKVVAIVQGGARGADSCAREWALSNLYPMEEYQADRSLGKQAGPMRNQEMLDESGANLVIAFPGGNGTYDMVTRAKRKGVEVIYVTQNEVDK